MKYRTTPRKIGNSWYLLIPNDFIQFDTIDPDKEVMVLVTQEV